ncbi:MAG: NAD-dependent epimerase/dehydratase family protein [Xanthomonadales bacterium]|uniref:NAD-dependent epimerase/dehydratase family protein n=1 Tax=Hydrogenophaga sp. TaxID=1904254 RepID=UPI0016A9F84E|nr:NAD(P)-dependent oxidoreductase [Hydrogenophaga sp.]NIM70696.1 NAD-dependent epimerase/dehydratase family protein [Xanthomonadales bacterium]NIN33451.1 NAD-dependent epimerase/dehydratase family protein [Hydrogenophaga sp.]NIN59973.1 NAD-dependent epimerase/dehydratase family protein [Xanthomonadales bacterium]NIN75346.1 NAD-dependent epimerase/dehydratase family protein [Xanthomonadales bacterium]NIO13515.1 NAD-dependent epimerase/dehydratase family protein [Xanthomonadales bacterium]
MNCIVTGSSGRLGRAVIELLHAEGMPCTGIDLTPSEHTDIEADIRDAEAIQSLLNDADAVIHTAALHGYHVDRNYPEAEFVRTNVLGTAYLLNAARAHGIRRFVYTSSTSVYGEAMSQPDRAVWVDEDLTPQPRDIYDATKLAAEQLCRLYFDPGSLQTCVLRVSRFMDEPLNDIANYRLYRGLDERDGARAHLLAIRHEHERFEIYNISNRSPFSRNQLAELKTGPAGLVKSLFSGIEDSYSRLDWQLPESIDRVYAIDKAERLLGYDPVHNFTAYVEQQLQQLNS